MHLTRNMYHILIILALLIAPGTLTTKNQPLLFGNSPFSDLSTNLPVSDRQADEVAEAFNNEITLKSQIAGIQSRIMSYGEVRVSDVTDNIRSLPLDDSQVATLDPGSLSTSYLVATGGESNDYGYAVAPSVSPRALPV